MASGITTAKQLQDVLDAIYDNISQMDVYTGLSELGSLRLCWNDISRTATIFKRINDEENREEVVCTFNPENIVIGTDTFQGKMLKNIVHNATTTVTRSNDVGLGGYVGIKTLIRNICAALGVNLAPNFDEINPTIYGELVNIVKKYYGDSLQNNAPYGLARKDTTSSGTTTTTYNSYIPVMIIVDIAIYLNDLGVFSANKDKLYQPLSLPKVYSSSNYNFYDYLDGFGTYYNFMSKDEYKKFISDWIDFTYTDTTTREKVHNTLNVMMQLYGQEINFDGIITCIPGIEMSIKVLDKKSVKMKASNINVIFPRNSVYSSSVDIYYSEDTTITTYTVSYKSSTKEYTNTKTVVEKAAGSSETVSYGGIFNIKCDKYLKPYYTRNSKYPNNFREDSDITNGSNSEYVFVDNYYGVTWVDRFYTLKLTDSSYAFRTHNHPDVYRFCKDNSITFTENDFAFGFNNGSKWQIYIARNTDTVKFYYDTSELPYRSSTTGLLTGVCCRYNREGAIYNQIRTPYIRNYVDRYTFDSPKSLDYYFITINSDGTITIDDSGNITSDFIKADFTSGSTTAYTFNVGEIVEIQETTLDGITLQDNATYPSSVIDYNSFNSTYPNWGKLGYSQPYFEEDQIAGTYAAQWAAISVDSDTPTSQADSQAGEIDFTDTDLVDDIIDDIDNADDNNDEEEVDPNSDEIEGEGETPDDELDRIEPNVLTGGFVKQYALNAAQMQALALMLTDPNMAESLIRLFRDPFKAIISLQLAYKLPQLASPTDIVIYGFNWTEGTAAPKGYLLPTNVVDFDFGNIHINPVYNTYQDITTTSMELYLPCVGFVPLDPAEFLDRGLDVEGKIDTLTGTIVYDISAYDGTKRKLLYQKTGNCQLQLPITGTDNSTLLGALMGVGSMALGGFTGNPMLMAGGASTFATGLAQGPNFEHGGSISANAGLMTKMIPCVIIKRNQVYNPTHLNELHGLPANSYVKLGSCSGYTVVQDVKVDIQGATQSEKSQIETLLKGGVIL